MFLLKREASKQANCFLMLHFAEGQTLARMQGAAKAWFAREWSLVLEVLIGLIKSNTFLLPVSYGILKSEVVALWGC